MMLAPVLAPAAGPLESRADLYSGCAACHGADGGGNQALNAPWLTHLMQFIFKPSCRNSDRASGVLPEKGAMADVVSFIRGLAD
jgi:cytochrome c